MTHAIAQHFPAETRVSRPSGGFVVQPEFVALVKNERANIDAALTWAASARAPAMIRVAVNVSAVQLHAAQFSHLVHEILLQTGLPDSLAESCDRLLRRR